MKQADQMVRGSIVLPHGIGKSLRVVVFAKGDMADKPNGRGRRSWRPEMAEKIKDGWTDFDVCIAAPEMMGVGRPAGHECWPAGLMPSPRAGTVTPEWARSIKEYKAGKVEFRNDAGGNVHAVVGKLSFDAAEAGREHLRLYQSHGHLKPAGVRGHYVKGIVVSATMSPACGSQRTGSRRMFEQ